MKNSLILTVVVLLLVGACASACKTAERHEKYYEKQQKRDDAAAQRSYNNKLKEFEKIQSKDTQKMMRETEKQARHINKSRKR